MTVNTTTGEDGQQTGAARMSLISAATFIGGLLEWYDFFLYGTAAALIFNTLFFPGLGPAGGTIASLVTFGVGFVARPVGGAIFGHFGDRLGRKSTLVATIVITGGGTFLIGTLPPAALIGAWAPVLLVLLRLVQGFGLGGEYAGAALVTIEHAPPGRRGKWGAIPAASSSAGLLLGTGVFGLAALLPPDQFNSWGWRIPFLLSAPLLIIGLVIRLRINETPLFQQAAERGPAPRLPLGQLWREHRTNLLLAFGARLVETVLFNLLDTFAIAYLTETRALPKSVPLTGILIGSALSVLAYPAFGALVDRIGARRVYLAGTIFSLCYAPPLFAVLASGGPTLIVLTITVGFLFGPTLLFAGEATFFADLFGTTSRYTGLSLAYQLSAIIGGFSPLIARTLHQPWLTATFLIVVAALSLASTYRATDRHLPRLRLAEQAVN